MKYWHKIIIAAMLFVTISIGWGNLPGGWRIGVVLTLFFWLLCSGVAFLIQIFTSERAYRPYALGTRFQRRIFWRTMAFGPCMSLFLDTVVKKRPLNKLPD